MNTQEHQGKVNVGDKYHRLTAKKFISLVKRSQAMWLWVCDCGKEHLATAGGVKSGSTKSCGCYKLETVKKIHKTHGMFYTREYSSWGRMIQRCTNEKDKKFPLYGGRGITVCERWRNSFEAFYADMGPRPSPDHSIDRIDVNGNYEPGNCRWATKKEQARNRRSNVIISFGGRKIILKVFSDICGISISRARYLLSQGYTPDEIYLTIKYKHTKRISRNTVNIIVDKNYPIDYDEIFDGQKYIPVEVIDVDPEFDIHKIKLL